MINLFRSWRPRGAGAESADALSSFIAWAIMPDEPPPNAHLRDALRLSEPSSSHRDLLGRLVSVTAARLGVIAVLPPGAAMPADALQLAIALALRNERDPDRERAGKPPWSMQFIGALPAPSAQTPAGLADLLARHGLLSALLRWEPEAPEIDRAVRRSPLTALLSRAPSTDEDNEELWTVIRVALEPQSWPGHGGWRDLVQRALAAPSEDLTRQNLLSAFLGWAKGENSPGMDDFALGVYETALVRHKTEVVRLTRRALDLLQAGNREATPRELELAFALVRWWGPFERLRRLRKKEIEDLCSIGSDDYKDGLALCDRFETREYERQMVERLVQFRGQRL
jgi:hypothetical protein